MRIDWIKAVNASEASAGARALALCLLQYMSYDGVCWPSQELLATTLRTTDRTVRRWMLELEMRNLVVRDKSKITASTGHQCPKSGHVCPEEEETYRTPVSENRTHMSKNRTPVSALANQEPDTSVLSPDTIVQEPDTSVLKNSTNELSNRTIQSVPCTLVRTHEPSPGSALDSDDRTDESALYLLAVFHEYRKHQVTTEQCVELVKDALRMGTTLAELEEEVRTVCTKLSRAGAWTLLQIVRENLETKAPQRLQQRKHLAVGRNTYTAPATEEEIPAEEQFRHIPF